MATAWPVRVEGETRAPDLAEVRRALGVLLDPAHGVQLQALPSGASHRLAAADLDGLCEAAASLAVGATGVYWSLNPVPPEPDQPIHVADVLARRWLLLDVDRVKTQADKDLSATDEEKEAVRAVALAVHEWLAGESWPAPVMIDSCNGWHLLYRIELPNDDASRMLLRDLLKALGARFGNAHAAIDEKMHNANRVSKLPGTWARKGPHTEERPHRVCRLIRAPEPLEIVSGELLRQTLATLQGEAETVVDGSEASLAPASTNGHSGNGLRVRVTDGNSSAYARRALEGECGRMALAPPGKRNQQLFDSGAALGNFVGAGLLDEDEVFRSLMHAAHAAGCNNPRKDEDTLRRGIERGKTTPREVPERNVNSTERRVGNQDALPLQPFPVPIPASQLRRQDSAAGWLWHGYINRGEITLISALWKAGKTTLLAHLLKSLETGREFCGYTTRPARVLYVTEESESRWADRRDQLDLKDHVEFMIRPFSGRPRPEHWEKFLDHLAALQEERAFDLFLFDTLANLWPVKDENDAAHVQAALMPLHTVLEAANVPAGMALVHHTRKSDGTEATAARGSGALSAFVDTIVEFRRFHGNDRQDRRRVLTGYGRHDETPDEVVVELTENGFVASGGDRQAVAGAELGTIILPLLPIEPPGLTAAQILDAWPGQMKPQRTALYAALNQGVDDGHWLSEGEGRKGDPRRYWRQAEEILPL